MQNVIRKRARAREARLPSYLLNSSCVQVLVVIKSRAVGCIRVGGKPCVVLLLRPRLQSSRSHVRRLRPRYTALLHTGDTTFPTASTIIHTGAIPTPAPAGVIPIHAGVNGITGKSPR